MYILPTLVEGKFIVADKATGRHLARSSTPAGAQRWMDQHRAQMAMQQLSGTGQPNTSLVPSLGHNKIDQFDINTRFGFVETMVRMIAQKDTVSSVITGRGGLGKTFTVRKTLEDCGLMDMNYLEQNAPVGSRINRAKAYRFIKGYSTAKALYRALYDNNNCVIVFDDCDSIQGDKTAKNILKSALDSYDKRIIYWNAETKGDDDLPRSFQFDGKVIFISNMEMEKIDGAIRSRSMTVDLTMSYPQMIDRMKHLMSLDTFLPDFDQDIKNESMALVQSLGTRIKDLNLRTLITVCKIRANGEENWKDMATYMVTN